MNGSPGFVEGTYKNGEIPGSFHTVTEQGDKINLKFNVQKWEKY